MMRNGSVKSTTVLLALLAVTAFGCSGNKTQTKVDICKRPYAKEGIILNINATPDLHTFEGQPHTVLMVVYQLSEPNTFDNLLGSAEGISRLLEADAFDASVLSRNTLFVEPSQVVPFVMDRAEGARYVGVIAGYYDRQTQKISHRFEVPTKTKRTLFVGPKRCNAQQLVARLVLGRDGILEASQ